MYKLTITINGSSTTFYEVDLSDIEENPKLNWLRSTLKKIAKSSESIEYIDFTPIGNTFIEVILYDGYNLTPLSIHNTLEEVIEKYGDSYKIVQYDPLIARDYINSRYGISPNPENKIHNAPFLFTLERIIKKNKSKEKLS